MADKPKEGVGDLSSNWESILQSLKAIYPTNNVIYRIVNVYTHCKNDNVKKKIMLQFTKESPLRVVIATIAFGMGIN